MQDDAANRPEAPVEKSGWQFNPEPGSEQAEAATRPRSATETVSWTASEFVAHEKGASWFIRLGLVIAVISIVVFVLTRDFITTGTIIFAGVVFGIFASRKPRVLNYQIDNAGIHIESKTYDFQAFKSFAVHEEGALHFLSFMPMKRFSPGLTVYFPPEEEPKVVNALSEFLPIAQAKEDAIDRFMRKIRF